MKDRIWTEYELKRRVEIAASAVKEIVSSEYPRDVVGRYMPKLLEYEILPNISWDGMSDDNIREFAKTKISPPGRLSKAPDFDHHNKKPLIPVFECIMLAIDVELETPIRTQTEEDQYRRILDLALSYGRAKRKPFSDWHAGPFGSYQVKPKKFIEWLKLIGVEPPDEWQPIGFERDEKQIVKGGPRYEEAVLAAINMRDDAEIPTPIKLDDLYQDMIDRNGEFPVNCGLNSSLDIESIKREVRREAQNYGLANKNPLKDARFLERASKN